MSIGPSGSLLARRIAPRTVTEVNAVEDLSHQLWTMRELLEQLVYKLEVQRLMLAAGRSRWLPFVESEIEAVVAAVTEVELARAHAASRVAVELGMPATTRLDDLVDRLDEGWNEIMRAHRLHLLSLYGQVEDATNDNRELAAKGLSRTRDVIAALTDDDVDVYDPAGEATSLNLAAQRLDRMV